MTASFEPLSALLSMAWWLSSDDSTPLRVTISPPQPALPVEPPARKAGGFFVGERQDSGQFANKLDRQLPVGRFCPQLLLVQRLRR